MPTPAAPNTAWRSQSNTPSDLSEAARWIVSNQCFGQPPRSMNEAQNSAAMARLSSTPSSVTPNTTPSSAR